MRRDFRRDLEVLDRLSAPDLFGEAQRKALAQGSNAFLDQPRLHRRITSLLLGLITLALAAGGYLWLTAAFDPSPAPLTEPVGSNYVFTNVRLDPGYSDPTNSEENLLIRLEVSWSRDESPGVHRCEFLALSADGQVVSERVEFRVWPVSDNVGIELTRSSEPAVDAIARCDAERLDTPGIVSLEPLDPATVGGDSAAFDEEIERRTDLWAARFAIETMSPITLVANMSAIGHASVESDRRGSEFMWAHMELQSRWRRLCELLPSDYSLPGGKRVSCG